MEEEENFLVVVFDWALVSSLNKKQNGNAGARRMIKALNQIHRTTSAKQFVKKKLTPRLEMEANFLNMARALWIGIDW